MLTHADIVKRSARWLDDRRFWLPSPMVNRPPAFLWVEKAVPLVTEMPDVLGLFEAFITGSWTTYSVMIEAKASRSDFTSDKAKPHRQGKRGLGDYRLYACPPRVIMPTDLPEGWGLLWVYPKMVRMQASPARLEREPEYKQAEDALALHAANYLWRGFAPTQSALHS